MQLKCNITKNWILRLLIMLIAVIMMGFSLSLLVMTKFGTDPCSSMNYGISGLLHLSFGNYQVIFNVVLLVLMILFYRSVIGFGTLGNMILVGYSSDFFTYIWHHVCHIPQNLILFTMYASILRENTAVTTSLYANASFYFRRILSLSYFIIQAPHFNVS